jgi:hypothetical protein
MVVHDAVAACVLGAFYLIIVLLNAPLTNCDNSIVRAFLIEEAKVVKRVIKSHQKAAGGRS